MGDDLIREARDFAIAAHGDQKYGDAPYRSHLFAVVAVLRDFGYRGKYEIAGWLHDVVEDCGVSLSEIKARFGSDVVAIVHAVSGEGDSRAERIASIYEKIDGCRPAAVVKLADRIANVEAAASAPDHWRRYMAEQDGFEGAIRRRVPAPMWTRLERALRHSAPKGPIHD